MKKYKEIPGIGKIFGCSSKIKTKKIIAVILLFAAGVILLSLVFLGIAGIAVDVERNAVSKEVQPQPEEDGERTFILITLDKITFADLLSYAGPVLAAMMKESAVALMNVNTAGAPGTESGYLSIGSGARLLGNWSVRRAFNREESLPDSSVQKLYQRHNGGEGEVPPGEVLHLYTGLLQRINEQRSYPFLLGALGQALSTNGLGVAVLGNADGDTPNRQAVAIAMNREGAVAYGDVGPSLLREQEDFPFGLASDPAAYLQVFEKMWSKAAFIVIEWGDTSRIDDYLGHLPYKRREGLLRASLAQLDQFLLGIKPFLARQEAGLLFVTPSPPNAAVARGQRLTPVIYYNPAAAGPRLLLSPTTRRPGLIANIDIAPSVLSFLGVKAPVFLFGTPFSSTPRPNHLEELAAMSERIVRIYDQRPAVIRGYITVQIVVLLGGLAGLIYRFRPVRILIPVLYALLFFPLAVLLCPVFPGFPAPSLYANAFLLLGLIFIFTFFALLFFRKRLAIFAFVGLLTFGLLIVDLLGGALWNSRSFLGYDPVGGARFYGLGNEYMGVLIGSFILGFASLLSFLLEKEYISSPCGESREAKVKAKVKEEAIAIAIAKAKAKAKENTGTKAVLPAIWLFLFFSFLILFVMASPVLGANFGGSVTAGAALSVTLGGFLGLLRRKGYALQPLEARLRRNEGKRVPGLTQFSRKAAVFCLFALVTALLLYFLNLPRSDAAVSHLGLTWDLVRSDGIQELWRIALRKVGMNWKLIRYSLWSRVMFLFIFLIIFLYYYPVGLSKKIFQEKPAFQVALGGIIAGTVVSFLVNDSGVVSAATTMLYGGLPLLLLCFEECFPEVRRCRE